MIPVTTAPTRIPRIGFPPIARKASEKIGESAYGDTAPDINSRPMKMKPTPIQKVPSRSSLPFLPNRMRNAPMAISTGEKKSGFSTVSISLEICVSETIQAVIVVPIFAPMMMPTACERFIMPAFTKPTTMTVVAEDDCTSAVIAAPSTTAIKRFFVTMSRKPEIRLPAAFCMPSLMTDIPYRNIPNPPRRRNRLAT